tara:strand:- start:38369 stop:38644 length:276 start_codon:yes stop_codon:yes gene_type:complete
MSDTPTWPTDEDVEKAARAIDSATRNALDTHGKFSSEEMARAALRAVNPYEGVRFPQSVGEASAMALFGTNYLEEHAPELLRQIPSPEGDR